MITTYDVIRHLKNDPKNTDYKVSEDNKDIIDIKTGVVICSVADFTETMRKKLHCDFTCIYSEHVSLETIYQCNECGTVIFASDDEWYDPNLCCPTCGGYHCHFQYWTKEEIDNDPEKQKSIEAFHEMTKMQIEADKRYRARGGLYDWQLFKKEFRFGNYLIDIEGRTLAGVDLEIGVAKKDEDISGSYVYKKFFTIPLSPYAFYIQFIFPYTKKCTDERLRKYAFWQKRPTNAVTQ